MTQFSENTPRSRILVIDDHEAILAGLIPALQTQYPQAQVLQAKFREEAQRILHQSAPLMLVVVDLSLPNRMGDDASAQVGFELVEQLLVHQAAPNILVLSTNLKPLIRLKSVINTYEGGFATADKSQPMAELLQMADLAIRGTVCWSRLLRQSGMSRELDRQWLEVVTLKFSEGLNDKAIAQRMHVSDRTVRNYWLRLQDTFGIPDDPAYDVRVQIMLRARELGLLE